MEELGIICHSNSPWSSPLHIVPKSDGSWRPCEDYHRLTAISEDDPHLQDFSAHLYKKAIFSKVDLVRGYYHIPVAAVDVLKTAIITPFGSYYVFRSSYACPSASKAQRRLSKMDRVK